MSILRPFLSRIVRQGRLTVVAPDGTTEIFGQPAPGYPDITIRFAHKAAMRRIILDPRLGAAEAFMDGDLELVDGDIMDFIGLIRMNTPWDRGEKLKDKTRVGEWFDGIKTRLNSINRRRQSRANVAHHYDIGNDLYRLFLDEDMQYSCAYWSRPDMTLDEAQVAKKAHIAAKLALKPGQRILDIGCGWGGMAITLAKLEQVEVLGITLSEEQLALARQRAKDAGVADRVRFELIDYRDLAEREPGRFDRIVSVGMFEHVGPKNYATYFDVVDRNLKPDGRFLLHTIGSKKTDHSVDPWINKYIFPNGCLPSVRHIAEASESHFVMEDWHNFGADYDTTLMAWYERFLASWPEIADNYSERFKRMFSYYLNACAGAFRARDIQLWQVVFSRGAEHGLRVAR